MQCRVPQAFTVALALLCAEHAHAQIRLYDAKRHAAAQEALKTVEKIQSGDLFRKQAENLRALSSRDTELTIADARLETQAMINGLHQWSDVAELKQRIAGAPVATAPEDVEEQKREIAEATKSLKGQIASLQAAAAGGADELKPLINTIGHVETALSFANETLGVDHNALRATVSVIRQLQGLYQSYQNQFEAVNKADQRLTALKVDTKRAMLGRLAVEEEFLLKQVALHDRNKKEKAHIEHWQKQCVVPDGVAESEFIDATLNRRADNPTELGKVLRSLFACASLAAEGMLPGRLLNLRLAQLAHLRSIQLSAANAAIYESVLGGGVTRLALFYQGGVRPETLAQFIQSLSTAGVFGKLLTQ